MESEMKFPIIKKNKAIAKERSSIRNGNLYFSISLQPYYFMKKTNYLSFPRSNGSITPLARNAFCRSIQVPHFPHGSSLPS